MCYKYGKPRHKRGPARRKNIVSFAKIAAEQGRGSCYRFRAMSDLQSRVAKSEKSSALILILQANMHKSVVTHDLMGCKKEELTCFCSTSNTQIWSSTSWYADISDTAAIWVFDFITNTNLSVCDGGVQQPSISPA